MLHQVRFLLPALFRPQTHFLGRLVDLGLPEGDEGPVLRAESFLRYRCLEGGYPSFVPIISGLSKKYGKPGQKVRADLSG